MKDKIPGLHKTIGTFPDYSSENRKDGRSDNIFALIISFISAFVVIMICSQSSFLYPINSWVDANCFFTVGKAMMNGKVVYRDIYEQKGILLYFLHGICTLISNDSFIGVFFLEVISATFFLFFSYKAMRLYCGKTSVFFLPIIAALTYSSYSFSIGDSAEELCLPLLSASLFLFLRSMRERRSLKFSEALIIGLLSGAVLWVKYTMLGFFIGAALILPFSAPTRKNPREFLVFIGGVLSGVFIITVPFFIYFAVNNALSDWFTVYFYNNIFLYSGSGGTIIDKLTFACGGAYANFLSNGTVSLFIIIGIIYVLLFFDITEKFEVILSFLLLTIFIYIGGTAYFYYFLIEAVYLPLGFIPIIRLFEIISAKTGGESAETVCSSRSVNAVSVLCALLFLSASAIISLSCSMNVKMMGKDRESLPQYRFAKIINERENATLLNYGWLDGGFYTAANIIPDCKFFCRLNMADLPEMDKTQNMWLDEAKCDFAVTYGSPLYHENYITIDSCSMIGFFGSEETYYLSAKKTDLYNSNDK